MVTPNQCVVLIIDDLEQASETYRQYLLGDQYYIYTLLEAKSAADGFAICQSRSVDAILLNYQLPDANGLQFLSMLKQQAGDDCPAVVMIADQGNESIAVKAIKSGADDYLAQQNVTSDTLRLTMRSAIEDATLRRQLQKSEERFHASVETMIDCYGIYSAMRDESGRIVDFCVEYVNAAACRNNQLTKEEQIGKGLCQILPGHRESGLFDQYCQLVETGTPLVKESLIYSDQYGHQYLVKAFDIRASKLEDGFVATWRDVTEQVRARLIQQQQREQEQILNQIVQQIRQSLELDVILQTTVTETRQFLQSDRVFIYRFNPDFSGVIVTESVGNGWESILNQQVTDTYFTETGGAAYCQGRIQIVPNIHTAGLADCHVELLERFQIQANLVVPILQGESLWGLLIANQCANPRQWEFEEVEFLKHLTEHVGIAIQQSELYEKVRQQLIAYQQIEVALTKQEDQFRTLIANIPSAVYRCLHTADWQGMYISDGIEAIAGYPAEDFSSNGTRTFGSIIAPEDQAQVDAIVDNALQHRSPFELEYRLIHADGSYRWVYEKGQGIFDEQGTLLHLDGIIFDITAQKQATIALQDRERRFATLAEVSPVAIFQFDPANNCTYVNHRWSEMMGRSVESAMGMGWVDTIHPEDRDRTRQAWMQWCETADRTTPFHVEARCLRPDGSLIWYVSQALPDVDESGRLVGYVGTLTDITELKQAEAALQENQQLLQLALAGAHAGTWNWEIQTDQIRWSPETYQLYGLDPTYQPQYVDWYNTLHPDDRVSIDIYFRRILAQKITEFSNEYRIIHPDRGERWLLSLGRVTFNQQNEPVWMSGINLDITDRKQVQQDLEAQVKERTATLQQVIRELQTTLEDLATSKETVREQLAEIEAIYATAPIGLCFIDRDLKFVRINEHLAEMNGVPASKHLERPLKEVLPGFAEELELLYQQVIQTGIPILNYEISGVTPAAPSVKRDWLASFYPLSDSDGQTLGVNVVAQEITDRKQAENRLRYQAQVIAQTHDSVVSTDLDGYITSWNKGAERLLGYAESEVLGQHIGMVYPDEQQVVLEELVVLPLLEKGEHEAEVMVQTKAGERIYVRLSLSLLRDLNQTPVGMIGYGMDITGRIRTEVALQESEKLYRTLVESQTENIIRADLEGKLTFANTVTIETFGFQPDHFLGQSIFQFVHPDDMPDVIANMQALNAPPIGSQPLSSERLPCRDFAGFSGKWPQSATRKGRWLRSKGLAEMSPIADEQKLRYAAVKLNIGESLKLQLKAFGKLIQQVGQPL